MSCIAWFIYLNASYWILRLFKQVKNTLFRCNSNRINLFNNFVFLICLIHEASDMVYTF